MITIGSGRPATTSCSGGNGDPCQVLTQKRKACHEIYGNRGEDCLHEELTEKRCLSLQYCPNQAKEYYGDTTTTATATSMLSETENGHDREVGDSSSVLLVDGGSTMMNQQPSYLTDKGLCASWAEHFAYNDELKYGAEVVHHHKAAQQIVNDDKKLKLECRAIAFQLAQCIRSKKLFPR